MPRAQVVRVALLLAEEASARESLGEVRGSEVGDSGSGPSTACAPRVEVVLKNGRRLLV